MPDTPYTERTRDSILDAIHSHQQRLDKIASRIVKSNLDSLAEPIADVEKELSSFIATVRSYQ